jgi:DNA-binding transcriptional LysR family regulator
MSTPDFNLLITLDAILTEGSVARAAQRLRLSTSAMSRALARLRETTGDPLLVRAGRRLVPTPRAIELREKVSQLVQDTQAVLRPAESPNLQHLVQTFSLRTSEGFVENFGAEIISRVHEEAPGITLCFLQKPDKESTSLRDGTVDLETGVIEEATSPELRTRGLFRDRFVGVVRTGHPLEMNEITLERYTAARHICVSRKGIARGLIDDALSSVDATRDIATIVGGFSTAVALARSSDLIATVPERHTGNLRSGMHTFELPFATPAITVSMIWHPRMDADPAHRWLRNLIQAICSAS